MLCAPLGADTEEPARGALSRTSGQDRSARGLSEETSFLNVQLDGAVMLSRNRLYMAPGAIRDPPVKQRSGVCNSQNLDQLWRFSDEARQHQRKRSRQLARNALRWSSSAEREL